MTLSYDDVIAKYEPVLGLEVHVELNTNSKMFCGCSTVFGAEPNTQTCPVCLALPGALPVVNEKAIESTIKIGLALNCSIAPFSRFARKNYFYPDMPKNFQISQYDEPICVDGYVDVEIETDEGPKKFRVEVERVHMEEDTGKSLHVGGATGRIHGAEYSLLDYNRAGIPLVEIVTKIVPGTGKYAPEVAKAYVAELRDILRALGVSDVKMEQGSLRCDANVSLRLIGAEKLGTRSETKNVNSLRSVERAVRGEMIRHAELLNAGGRVVQETRHFQEDTGLTRSGRSKEQAEDYRYFPEPDLVPVAPDAAWIEELRATLPERPSIRRKRLQEALPVAVIAERKLAQGQPAQGAQRVALVASGGWMLTSLADLSDDLGGGRTALGNAGNRELLLALAAWLAGRDELLDAGLSGREVPRIEGLEDTARRTWMIGGTAFLVLGPIALGAIRVGRRRARA